MSICLKEAGYSGSRSRMTIGLVEREIHQRHPSRFLADLRHPLQVGGYGYAGDMDASRL